MQKKIQILNLFLNLKNFFFKDVNLQSKSQESIVYNSKLNNCKLAFDVDSRKLIEKAKCVIGFNSTTLIESLILKKPIIVPIYGLKKTILNDFTLDLKNSAYYVRNQKELNNILYDIILGKIVRPKAKKKVLDRIIKKYIGNCDGKSSKRLINYLI